MREKLAPPSKAAAPPLSFIIDNAAKLPRNSPCNQNVPNNARSQALHSRLRGPPRIQWGQHNGSTWLPNFIIDVSVDKLTFLSSNIYTAHFNRIRVCTLDFFLFFFLDFIIIIFINEKNSTSTICKKPVCITRRIGACTRSCMYTRFTAANIPLYKFE